jgi:hypothetical protein
MRKVSPGITWCVLLGVFALILGACIRPVDLGGFLDNEIVKEIIGEEKKEGPEIDIDYKNPEDHPPELSDGSGSLADGAMVTVALGDSVTITVTNAADYDGGIEWALNGVPVGVANDPSYIVNTNNAPFNAPFDKIATYQLMVTGTKDGKPYYTEISIKVTK